MNFKKYLSVFVTAVVAASSVAAASSAVDLGVCAQSEPNPVISRNCPAYSQSSPSTAASANDAFYYSFWSGTASDYLAYDLSDVPAAQRKKVLAVWYNATGQYDYTVVNQNSNGMPTDYTIEVNKAAGGEYPENGWEVVDTVSENTLHSRQHVVDMEGYNWIRMNVTKADGKSGGSVQINFDIHNVSEGIDDSWIFFGDSITAGGMMNCYGTGYAEYISQLDSKYFPAQENGGIGGIFSTDGAENIERWLETFPGKYVSIAYGTNDAWGDQTGAEKYYENTAFMVKTILESGKTPIVPKIPYSTETGVNSNLDSYNDMVDKIYKDYPQVIKGPDFDSFFRENPDMLSSDGVHPNENGYDEMRKLWAKTMYENVYTKDITIAGTEVLKGDINSDKNVNISDLTILAEFLIKKNDMKKYADAFKAADMNSDSKINVFDWIMLKRKLISEGEKLGDVKSTSWKATAENTKLVGRNVIKDDITWLVQSGSAAEFNVTGESAEIVLAGDSGINADKDYRPRYAVFVDDEMILDKTMDSKEETVKLFAEKSSVTKKVKVIMLSEAMYGAVGVSKINVSSGAAKPVKPVAKGNLCIEFIGDSITCAYGVEGEGSGFKTTTENFTKSYAYLTAMKLGADYNTVCYSGHGIISGYTSGEKNTESLIPDCYEVASKQAGYAEKWDFEAHKNDVVVINLGTNDSSYIAASGSVDPDRAQEYMDGYVEFLKTVRKNNSEAYIICTLGTMDFQNIYEYAGKAVEQYKTETGDEKIMFYQAVMHTQADGFGSDYHPSELTQQNISYVLADKICNALGIESDQVGLDVAGEAAYDMVINKDGGANAFPYIGYDKSFNINTVTGGSKPEDIKGVLSGIGLKKNGEYRLEFDCVTGKEFDMIVQIVGSKGYFSDTFKTSTSKEHYSTTFVCSDKDENASIEFLVGGVDSCNMTLSSIKLIKIK